MLKELFKSVFHPAHLRRTGLIALVVGTWLTAINEGDVILAGAPHAGTTVKVALNYITPFVVANLGLLSRTTEKEENDGRE